MLSHHDLLLTVQFSVYIFFSFHVYVHIHVGVGYCVYAGEFAHVCAFMWRSKADLGFFLINLPQYSLSQCLSVKSKTWWYTYKLVQRISYFCFLMKLESQEAEHPFLDFNCVWRSKPWSLCLQDKHFNNWAISLTNLQFLSGISCPILLDLLRWHILPRPQFPTQPSIMPSC